MPFFALCHYIESLKELDVATPFGGLENDPYRDYWQVYVHYCSSDTWAGTRAADEETGGYNFYGKVGYTDIVRKLLGPRDMMKP